MSESELLAQETVLPPAVRRAAAEAERLAAEATAAAAQPPADPPGEGEERPDTPPPETTTVVEQPKADPPPAPKAEPTRDAAYWEQRARSIQGKYDAEVPQLAAQLRAGSNRIAELERQVNELTVRLQTAKTAPQPKAPEIAPEDEETYGRDFIEKVRTWTGGTSQSPAELQELREELIRLKGQVAQSSTQQTRQTVQAQLDSRVPNWKEINNDPAFIGWLSHVDPFSGNIRHEMLKNAYESGDAYRTLAFFEAFIAEQTATGAGSPPSHTAQPAAAQVPLADLVAPGRGRPANPGAQPEKRIWTQPQIKAFYNDCAAGKYRHNEAERNRIEADIFAAVGEGRTP